MGQRILWVRGRCIERALYDYRNGKISWKRVRKQRSWRRFGPAILKSSFLLAKKERPWPVQCNKNQACLAIRVITLTLIRSMEISKPKTSNGSFKRSDHYFCRLLTWRIRLIKRSEEILLSAIKILLKMILICNKTKMKFQNRYDQSTEMSWSQF